MRKVLELLDKDCRLAASEIASMLDMTVAEVEEKIRKLEDEKIILGYRPIIDWEKVDKERISALIEIHIAPQQGQGFERVARRISQYDEVESVYLMSGGYDLFVSIRGKTLKEVAMFVAEKLAPLKEVTATATHFVLQKFKKHGVRFEQKDEGQERLTIL
ncbi:MAG: Lrp/AsnC family transcriptional regulator [Clostridia bacterium]|nr:Lrp/AsnC family transcriptional regulator [Clostridia bacterium]